MLVAIDYPDPIDERQQLKKLSGGYKIEFIHLIKPYANDQFIEIREHDEMDGDFIIDDPKNYCRYYLVEVKIAMSW